MDVNFGVQPAIKDDGRSHRIAVTGFVYNSSLKKKALRVEAEQVHFVARPEEDAVRHVRIIWCSPSTIVQAASIVVVFRIFETTLVSIST